MNMPNVDFAFGAQILNLLSIWGLVLDGEYTVDYTERQCQVS